MSIKSKLALLFAKKINTQTKKWSKNPVKTQQIVFGELIKKAQQTEFGKDHGFDNIKTFQDFATNVPIRDYENLKHYVDKVVEGKSDILWPGKPLYFAKTSEIGRAHV